VRFCVLASGSSGNTVYLESNGTRVLVDAGLSGKELEKRLDAIGVNSAQLDGILVTHEHTDHILGVGTVSRKYEVPVYIHPDTLGAAAGRLGRLPSTSFFEVGVPFRMGHFRVTSFPVPHDAANPVGFTFTTNGKKLGVATDMGYVTPLIRERLTGANALILESNHDLAMLKKGPYAWSLKQRVMGRRGHLSNEDAGMLLRSLLHRDLSSVVLAHISQVNNRLSIAYRTALKALRGGEGTPRLYAARQGEVGSLIEIPARLSVRLPAREDTQTVGRTRRGPHGAESIRKP